MIEPQAPERIPAGRKARQLAKHLRGEGPDYAYLEQVFRHLREELGVEVQRAPKKLPHVPEEEIRSFYEAVWSARWGQDLVMIKTLLYTGVRVSELVLIRLGDVALDYSDPDRARQGQEGPLRPVPRNVQGSVCTSHRRAGARRCQPPLRVLVEEALLRSWRAQDPRPVRHRGRDRGPDQPAPAPPFPVHVAEDPGNRRRADPALIRTRHPVIAGDLLADHARRRATSVRAGDRAAPRLSPRASCAP